MSSEKTNSDWKSNAPQWAIGVAVIIMSGAFFLKETNATQIALLQDTVSDQGSTIAALEATDSLKTDLISAYADQLEEAKENRDDARIELSTVTARYEQSQIEIKRLSGEVESLTEQVRVLTERMVSLKLQDGKPNSFE